MRHRLLRPSAGPWLVSSVVRDSIETRLESARQGRSSCNPLFMVPASAIRQKREVDHRIPWIVSWALPFPRTWMLRPSRWIVQEPAAGGQRPEYARGGFLNGQADGYRLQARNIQLGAHEIR